MVQGDPISEPVEYQVKRLFSPTPRMLEEEQAGRVFIYDSLMAPQVNAAMDSNFDRIENMMFTRIRRMPPTGAGPMEVEEDGCD